MTQTATIKEKDLQGFPTIYGVAVLANTDFFADDLEPDKGLSTLRIQVQLSIAGILSLVVRRAGVPTLFKLNDGDALDAGVLKTFAIEVRFQDSGGAAFVYNLQTSVGATIDQCFVSEVLGG